MDGWRAASSSAAIDLYCLVVCLLRLTTADTIRDGSADDPVHVVFSTIRGLSIGLISNYLSVLKSRFMLHTLKRHIHYSCSYTACARVLNGNKMCATTTNDWHTIKLLILRYRSFRFRKVNVCVVTRSSVNKWDFEVVSRFIILHNPLCHCGFIVTISQSD